MKTKMTATEQTDRIDSFIKKHFTESKSESGISASETARAASRHGFTGSANARYASFLEAFRSSPELTAVYSDKYPACQFLPWSAFHAIRNALKLWCDLPEFYAGAVPAEQIPWMDVFELDAKDTAKTSDILSMVNGEGDFKRVIESLLSAADGPSWMHDFSESLGKIYRQSNPNECRLVESMYRQFRQSFFVLAPADAFTSREDFIERFRRVVQAASRTTVAPNDPLVIKPCRGGCLIVAAWGDEAAFLNSAVKELNL